MKIFLFLGFLTAVFGILVWLNQKKEQQIEKFQANLQHGQKVRFSVNDWPTIGIVLTVIDNHALVQDYFGECYTVVTSEIYPA